MMLPLLWIAAVAALGHFVISLAVRQLNTHKALRVYWMAVGAGLLVIASAGCGPSLGFGGPSKARPNRPGWVQGEFHTQDPVTGERTYVSLTGQGAENADEPMTATATKDGIGFNSGTSAAFDWGAVAGNPVALAGCILVFLGVALLVIGKHPIAGFVIPGGAGWTAVGVGAGLIALPFVIEALKPVIMIGSAVAMLGLIVYYGHKLKWVEKATDSDAIMDRLDKGDVQGAAAMAYINRKGNPEGRMRARAIKRNGAGVALDRALAAAAAQPLVSPASVTAGPTAPATFTHVEVPPMPIVPPMPTVTDPTQPGG